MKYFCRILLLFLVVGLFSSLNILNADNTEQNTLGGTICTIDTNKTYSTASIAPEFIGGTFIYTGIIVPNLDSLPIVDPADTLESFTLKMKNGVPVMELIKKAN